MQGGVRIFYTKIRPIPGSDYYEIYGPAVRFYRSLVSKTKRRAYVRSRFFDGQKIFVSIFWSHLFDKTIPDRVRRMKYLPCAVELIAQSHHAPITTPHPNNQHELHHRFYGSAPNGKQFVVQIKEDTSKHQMFLISVFPVQNEKIPR